jgi:hypothetical protein
MIELNESRASFRKSTGEKAVRSERTISWSCSVKIEHVLRFIRDIDEVGNGSLHPESHLIGRDAGVDLWILNEEISLPVKRANRFDKAGLLAG